MLNQTLELHDYLHRAAKRSIKSVRKEEIPYTEDQTLIHHNHVQGKFPRNTGLAMQQT
jgi:hypothetical protein